MGRNVENVKQGDRVVVHFLNPCGDCNFCIAGRSNVCKNINLNPMYGFSAD